MTVRAVFFDMGGTVETFWYTPELRLRATPELNLKLQAAGIDLQLGDSELCEVITSGLKRYHKRSLETNEELPVGRVWREFILPAFPQFAEKIASAAEELMVFIELNYFHRELRPEVPGVLEALRKSGLKIGLISNVCSQSQVALSLKNYAILEYFDPIVLSSQYGRRKPDPAIFHYAARLANVPTRECIYVGDRIARDIVGARRAGYGGAVQIVNDFDHGEKDDGAKPDALIRSMTELLDFLKTEGEKSAQSACKEKRIRALLFDAGDILYFRPNRGLHLRTFLKELGLEEKDIPAAAKNSLKHQAYHGEITQRQYREAVLRLYGITDPALVERGVQLMDEDDNNIQVIKGVPETLKKLKQEGYLLAIVTDTAMPLHTKLMWFERGGFGDVWDSVISSKELGTQKPNPVIYHAALEQLGVTVDQAAFVGHSPEELEGARALGMLTIAFNYKEDAKADFYVNKFADLLKVPLGAAVKQGI